MPKSVSSPRATASRGKTLRDAVALKCVVEGVNEEPLQHVGDHRRGNVVPQKGPAERRRPRLTAFTDERVPMMKLSAMPQFSWLRVLSL